MTLMMPLRIGDINHDITIDTANESKKEINKK
jgi:hypothetical protein